MLGKKSEMGIATLVLFTAIILVSAIIFSVFTSTANQVNQDARSTAMTIQENIGIAIHSLKLFATDGSDDNKVDYFFWEIKPPYASDEVKLNETVLLVSLNNISGAFTYNNSINCSNTSHMDVTENALKFGITYVGGTAEYQDTVVAGELVRLCWKAPRSVEKDDKLLLEFVGKRGYNARLDVAYRRIMSDRIIYFFP